MAFGIVLYLPVMFTQSQAGQCGLSCSCYLWIIDNSHHPKLLLRIVGYDGISHANILHVTSFIVSHTKIGVKCSFQAVSTKIQDSIGFQGVWNVAYCTETPHNFSYARPGIEALLPRLAEVRHRTYPSLQTAGNSTHPKSWGTVKTR